MNFTSEIKRELLHEIPEKQCCRTALLRAFLDTAGSRAMSGGAKQGAAFTSEHEDVAEYILALAAQLGFAMTLTEAVRDPKHGRDKLTFSCRDARLATALGETERDLQENECCLSAYLKGAFLGGGSCTLPRGTGKTGYHLEFIFHEERAAGNFCELLERLQLLGSVVRRGETFVVYVKNRDTISDFLSAVGAAGALRKLEQVSAVREENNQENRVLNCMAGNADKSAIASAAHVVAISGLQREGLLAALSKPLRDTAQARLAFPTYSLAELASELGISKSCLNHRLRKLMQIYSESSK